MMRQLHFSLFSMCLNSLITIYAYCIYNYDEAMYKTYTVTCRASGQSGTGMKKNADAGTSPVPE
jgi:hypothetical protein